MTSEEALELLEIILKSDYLNQTQEVVFCGSWNGQSYMEIANTTGYDYGYVKDTGAQLWRSLSDALGEKVTKKNVCKVLSKIDRQSIQRPSAIAPPSGERRTKHSWEEKIDVEKFYGRLDERATIENWIFKDRSRLVSVLGIGGVGKTALSTRVATDAQEHFDYVIWRTLRHAPPLNELLSDIILVLSEQQDVSPPEHSEQRIGHLLSYLAKYRCLLILDNVESILQKGTHAGCYRETYQEYASLFERIADEGHQSCLLITSRESPVGLFRRSGTHSLVKALHLDGLDQAAIREVIHDKGLTILDCEHEQLYSHYCGNPLALKIVAATINAVFGGNVSEFLNYGTLIFGDLWDVLEQQFLRLPALEQKIMYWLAINRSWVKLSELREDLLSLVPPRELLEAVESLKARSLIETSVEGITQQPVVMEYMT
ncbi:MAG: NB-ARC domain-containing protein, partial [Cyanobacteria bacterium P01_D01_bin.36]